MAHLTYRVLAQSSALAGILLLGSCSSLPASKAAVVAEVMVTRTQASDSLKSADEALRKRQLSQAENFYRLALLSYEAVDDLAGQCTVLDSLGFLYLSANKLDAAGAYWDQEAALAALVADAKLTARALANQGRYAQATGKPTEAVAFFDRALVGRASLDGAVVAVILQAKAQALRAQEKMSEALTLLDEAAALNEKAGAWQEQASNLFLAASLQSKSGQTADALLRLTKALTLDKRSENTDGIAADLLAMATIHSRGTAEEKSLALAEAERSYRTALAGGLVPAVGKALKLLVEISAAVGDTARLKRFQDLLNKL